MPTPISIPSTPAFTNSRFSLKRVTGISESPFSGVQQTYEHPYALWTGTFTLPPMKRDTAASWLAFMMKLRGRSGTFLIGDPDAKSPRGSVTGSVVTTGTNSKGSYSLTIDTAVNSGTGVFKQNDYIQIGTGADAKLYMVVDDANTNSTGATTLTIEPALKVAVSSGTTVTYSSPVGVFRMDTADLGWDTNHVSNYGISFSCTEAL